MQAQVAHIDMKTPGAKEALAAWSHIDPTERAKWATPWQPPKSIADIDAEMAVWKAGVEK